MTSPEWDRCVEQMRGAWPTRLRSDGWARTWFRELQEREFRVVAWAVVRAIRQPVEHPPSLGQFLEYVRVEERQRGVKPAPPPEEDVDALYRELRGDPPPPARREDALAHLREMGVQLPALEGSG